MTKDSGGPAFPSLGEGFGNPKYHDAGMTLRDWYMGKALEGLCANPGGPIQSDSMRGWGFTNCTAEDVANLVAVLADAVISERTKESTT